MKLLVYFLHPRMFVFQRCFHRAKLYAAVNVLNVCIDFSFCLLAMLIFSSHNLSPPVFLYTCVCQFATSHWPLDCTVYRYWALFQFSHHHHQIFDGNTVVYGIGVVYLVVHYIRVLEIIPSLGLHFHKLGSYLQCEKLLSLSKQGQFQGCITYQTCILYLYQVGVSSVPAVLVSYMMQMTEWRKQWVEGGKELHQIVLQNESSVKSTELCLPRLNGIPKNKCDPK